MSLFTAPDAAPLATAQGEIVKRPDPGLARGVWEAPRWSFFVAIAVVLVLATLYALRRVKAKGTAR